MDKPKALEQPIKGGRFKKNVSAFFRALFLSFVFLIICNPFLIDANNLTVVEKASIGNVNLWRIVLGFGCLSIITAVYFLIRRKEDITLPSFLFLFWALGGALVYFVSYKTGNGGIQLHTNIANVNMIGVTISSLLFYIWILGIYYCRKLAKLLSMNTKIATLASVFLPILSILFYIYFLYQKREKKRKN